MVQFIPLWQNFPSCVWRQYVINYGNVPYHEAQCSVLRVCLYCTCTADREDHVAEHGVRRRHAAIRTLSSRRRDVCRSTTRKLHRGSQPLDVFQLSQAERGQNRAALGWVTSRSAALLGSAGPSLQLGTETVAASDQVRVVGVTLTSVGPVSRQARCQRLCDMLLLALPTQTGPTFT